MNDGGFWPAKCSSGWPPLPPSDPAISAPPSQQQPQMGMNSIVTSRFNVSQELPGFGGINPVRSQPHSTELRSPPLAHFSEKYPSFQNSSLEGQCPNNALQVNGTGFASGPCALPFLEGHGKEAQNSVHGGSLKDDHTQSAYRVQTLDFRAPQKTPVNAILSSWHGDQRLVFCMNAVGELVFASGHLGVICFCHRSTMSVAAFCEHSGGIGNKAGESVYMENGMTIARWVQFFLGIHRTHWDWPNSSSLQTTVIQPSSLDRSIVRSFNEIVNQNQLHKAGGPPTSETNVAHNRNLYKLNSFLSPNCTSAELKGKTSTSIPNSGFQLVSHSANASNFAGQGVSLWNGVRNEKDVSSSHFASRFELKLGQQPNLTSNPSKDIIHTTRQLTTEVDAQTHSSQPAVNECLSLSENSGSWQVRKEHPHLNQILLNKTANTLSHSTSPSDDFNSDSSKNSSISLFLSHLERKDPLESGDDILGITDSLRGSNDKILDKCKNGNIRLNEDNSNLNSHLNPSRAGGFPCNVTDALKTSSPNSESLNFKNHGFELIDNSWHRPEKCARVCEATPLHGKMCCLSNLKFQNSFGQDSNNKALHEGLVHKFQCATHSEVCRFPVRCISSCVVCSRERLSAQCTRDSEKSLYSVHETIPTCGAHCISRCHKRPIPLLEDDGDYNMRDANKRPKPSTQCECSWKDVSGKKFLDFPLKDAEGTFLIRNKEISSISSGSSAPAVTELSVETDKECEVGPAAVSVSLPLPADEASLVEKCGSSDEKHEACTTIEPSLSWTSKLSTLQGERAELPTASMPKKPCDDVGLVKRDKELVEPIHNTPVKCSEMKGVLSAKNKKEKLVDQANHGPQCNPGTNESNLDKKGKEKLGCLVDHEPENHFEISETFSEKKKKVDKLVKEVHRGPRSYSKISESFSEDTEETSVALVHRRPMSCFKANTTFSKRSWEPEVNTSCRGLMNHLEARKQPKYKYLSQIGIDESETKNKNSLHLFRATGNKPIVCGKFGIISNGMSDDALKPVKIVSLISVLQRTKSSSYKILQNKPENLGPLTSEKPRIRNIRAIIGLGHHNHMKNGAAMVKPTLSQSAIKSKSISSSKSGEYSRKFRRVKMKSILLDVMEREGISKSEQSPEGFTGLIQEESYKEIQVNPSVSRGECQQFPASQAQKPRHADQHIRPSLSEVSCSVCRSSIEEDINKILHCKHCKIKVHQACYGIPRHPKGPWYCRPCKAGLVDPVCVLCGYEGGAMTRAQKPRKLINNLIKYLHKPGFGRLSTQLNGAGGNRSIVHWVHMVCGLWTPSTRCPNVNTMAAFDLSGTHPSRKNKICSVCRRPGGSCVKCRVSGCTIVFHPWCAHRKGLLQNEVEGEHCDKVGFYGRCMYHATADKVDGDSLYFEANGQYASNEGWKCARTEVYKGIKGGQYANGTFNNIARKSNSRACVVSEEQINAWRRINGQKPFINVGVKSSFSSSDVELDLQKEYVRYKQLKGWKNLVVYKSCIHALGLYTSCFIPHGAMVIEYVGEIVRLRVADKREREYQSGRKLHSKSACYFFRIDEDNIIDATRKGGIARFVNHSCSANCVAKIISVMNEKKVVFIATRDINPGEEITYDYHFNPENEGEKIPCLCNSKNCRQFLN